MKNSVSGELLNSNASHRNMWCSLDIPSSRDDANVIEEKIISLCQKYSYSPRDIFALKLALEEALTNAIRHGNGGKLEKHIHIKYRVTRQRADIVIADEGAGFNPAAVPDPTQECNLDRCGGRGLLLMRAYMNSVVFNPVGNSVTLTKFNESRPTRAHSNAATRIAFG